MHRCGFVGLPERSYQCLAQASALNAEDGGEGGADEDYASSGSEADDEATLEEEDALAAQDGLDQKVWASLLAQFSDFPPPWMGLWLVTLHISGVCTKTRVILRGEQQLKAT